MTDPTAAQAEQVREALSTLYREARPGFVYSVATWEDGLLALDLLTARVRHYELHSPSGTLSFEDCEAELCEEARAALPEKGSES